MKIDKSRGYDEDEVNKLLDEIDAREFGILLARYFVKQPSSSNQAAVRYAVDHLDPWGFGFGWEAAQSLINRIAKETA